jgi:hypothetical protein
MQELNIVEFIENNPITKLSKNYNSKLLNKIKDNFSSFEQKLFVSSFYCYLNYDKNIDFVIDLDNIWKWLGFSQKNNAIMLLEKNFNIDIDYKKSAFVIAKALSDLENLTPEFSETKKVKKNGGQNRQIIMLTIKCFKSLCLKAQTQKSNEIHEYYIKMEEILHEIIEEESNELKMQLEKKNIELQQKQTLLENSKIEKQREIEKAIIKQFPINTECIYIGTIDNTNEAGEKLIKFGHSNELPTRVVCHRKNYNNFVLIEAFRVQNKVEIENLIKTHKIIKKQMRSIIVNEKNKTEIIAYDDAEFTIEKLIKIIKDIIQSKIYSIDNFNNLMKKKEELEDIQRTIDEKFKIQEEKYKTLEDKNKTLELTIKEQNIEIIYLKEKLEEKGKIIESVDKEHESVYKNVLLPEDELNKKFDEFIKEICIVRPDVEEKSVNIEGRYRLWSQVKPKKEVFHALKNYLDIRFKPKKINGIHSYNGIRLKEVEYKKRDEESDVQRFIFHACQFSDTGKILNSTLLKEYQKWKLSLTKETSDNDIKELKDYLNTSPYALKATVWVDNESNEGYYGIGLKTIGYQPKYVSTTGKKVYKVEYKSNLLLSTFDSILNASLQQDISRVAMSRAVKNKTVFNNDYYYTSDIGVINNNIE